MKWPSKEVEGMQKEVSVILSAVFNYITYCNETDFESMQKKSVATFIFIR
jgi:hypothetical protein